MWQPRYCSACWTLWQSSHSLLPDEARTFGNRSSKRCPYILLVLHDYMTILLYLRITGISLGLFLVYVFILPCPKDAEVQLALEVSLAGGADSADDVAEQGLLSELSEMRQSCPSCQSFYPSPRELEVGGSRASQAEESLQPDTPDLACSGNPIRRRWGKGETALRSAWNSS